MHTGLYPIRSEHKSQLLKESGLKEKLCAFTYLLRVPVDLLGELVLRLLDGGEYEGLDDLERDGEL